MDSLRKRVEEGYAARDAPAVERPTGRESPQQPMGGTSDTVLPKPRTRQEAQQKIKELKQKRAGGGTLTPEEVTLLNQLKNSLRRKPKR